MCGGAHGLVWTGLCATGLCAGATGRTVTHQTVTMTSMPSVLSSCTIAVGSGQNLHRPAQPSRAPNKASQSQFQESQQCRRRIPMKERHGTQHQQAAAQLVLHERGWPLPDEAPHATAKEAAHELNKGRTAGAGAGAATPGSLWVEVPVALDLPVHPVDHDNVHRDRSVVEAARGVEELGLRRVPAGAGFGFLVSMGTRRSEHPRRRGANRWRAIGVFFPEQQGTRRGVAPKGRLGLGETARAFGTQQARQEQPTCFANASIRTRNRARLASARPKT